VPATIPAQVRALPAERSADPRTGSPRAAALIAEPTSPMVDVISRFMDWQEQIDIRLQRADGLDLQRAKQRSPILPILTWRLGTFFALTLAHERRHLWQARQVRIDPKFPV